MKTKHLGLLAGVVIVMAGAIIAWFLLRTAPVAATKEKKSAPKIVQTIEVAPGEHAIAVSAYGTVVPARRVIVRPEITGRITSQHPALVPGGQIPEGEILFTIDDSDYRIALREAKTALEDAEADVALEEGRQTVAQREYEQLLRDLPAAEINRTLVLREPFKRQTEAALERAAAAVAKAELDLSRTTVPCPFNALVIDESVETGQLADSGTPLATLVGSDAFWVQANIPMAELKWIRFPADGKPGARAKVRVATANGGPNNHTGEVVRLLGDLDAAGRLARVLIEVPSPLDPAHGPPLLLGAYVRVEIDAGTLRNVREIPRFALREGDRLWLVSPENQLVIREADILWRRDESVLVRTAFEAGEALIVSDLIAPLPGMRLNPQPSTTDR
jgi:RND family efflux transporter MFP subunit